MTMLHFGIIVEGSKAGFTVGVGSAGLITAGEEDSCVDSSARTDRDAAKNRQAAARIVFPAGVTCFISIVMDRD